MNELKDAGKIRKTLNRDGEFLVSFFNHDGYFRLGDAANRLELRKKIETAQSEEREISFSYDRNLTILEIEP